MPETTPALIELPGWRDPLEILEASRGRRRPALLHSAGGDVALARFSVFAADPYLTVTWREGRARVRGPGGDEDFASADPFALLGGLVSRHPCVSRPPWPFVGGAIGFVAYDAARALERLPSFAVDDRAHPEMDFALYAWAICWDHVLRRWAAIASGAPAVSEPARAILARAQCEEAASWALRARAGRAAAPPPVARGGPESPSPLRAGLDLDAYVRAVSAIKEHIAAGDCYEVNLTRRLTLEATVDSYRLFAALSRASPAPFAACIEGDSCTLVGSSPERFLRCVGRRVESRPIKGTAPRGGSPEQDGALAARLIRSAKDRAENVMIVDLVRNDLGRVCRPGRVEVVSLCALESYAGVHHLVSTVAGDLQDGCSGLDSARVLFPPGSMTGAPRIRAMEIIEALEPSRRGPYAGAAGYVSASGDVDLSVVIRTFVLSPGRVDLQVGGAVVWDSDPAAEYEESAVKGRLAMEALREALGWPAALVD